MMSASLAARLTGHTLTILGIDVAHLAYQSYAHHTQKPANLDHDVVNPLMGTGNYSAHRII